MEVSGEFHAPAREIGPSTCWVAGILYVVVKRRIPAPLSQNLVIQSIHYTDGATPAHFHCKNK